MRTNTSKRVVGAVLALVMVSLLTPRVQALPPDPDNAALLYYQAFLSLAELDDEARTLLAKVARGNIDPNDKVREYIQQCKGGIGFAEAAAEVPACHWGFRFSLGFDALMPQLAQARFLAFVLVADARVRAADGDYRGALERCLMMGTFARHIGDDTLVSYLVAIAVRALSYRCMEDVIGQTGDDVKLLEWLQRELATSSEWALSPIRPLKVETEIVADLMQMKNVEKMARVLGEADEKTRERIIAAANEEMLAQARKLYAERVTKALSILAEPLPYEQAFIQLEQLTQVADANDASSVGVAAFLPAISRIYSLKTRVEADTSALKVAVAICLDKAKSGQFPRNLPPDAPKDPFSGRAFEYERTDEGFTLRCRAKELGTDRLREYTFAVK